MARNVNIDEFLQKQTITFTLNGKEFRVKDVPLEVRKMLEAEKIDEVEIVKKVLGCSDADLKGYGLVALNHIIKEVSENLFQESSQENQ